jgi:flagellar P-ring protein precursor FlgI
MRTRTLFLLAAAFLAAALQTAAASPRVKDISSIAGDYSIPLIGYGLVVGLDGTGDGKNTQFTVRSLANMLQRMGVTVDANQIKVKNVAAVIVTGHVSPLDKPGGNVDVTVSSVGDASSLQGGMLLLTPLSGPDGVMYAAAQGPVTIGGFNIESGDGNKIRNNYTLVGRIPNGALVQTAPPRIPNATGNVQFSLHDPDITTASRMANAINARYGEVATAVDAATVEVTMPPDPSLAMTYLARLELVELEPDSRARVVINEKTGTIVAGGNVTVAPVALAHGALTVEITASPVIVQPEPLSKGETISTYETEVSVQEGAAKVVAFEEAASIGDVAAALNAIGATPRDIIAIFQALREAGALRAELVIM